VNTARVESYRTSRLFLVSVRACRPPRPLLRLSESDITESDMKRDPDDYLPLAPAALHILLSLAGEAMHGYGIMQEVLRQSAGRYNLGPGTLYDNLQRLMKQRMVEEVAGPREEENSRRRYYRLSSLGRGVLAREIARLEDVVEEGRTRLRALKPRRA